MPLPQHGRPVVLCFVASGLVFDRLLNIFRKVIIFVQLFGVALQTLKPSAMLEKKKLIVEPENPFACERLLL